MKGGGRYRKYFECKRTLRAPMDFHKWDALRGHGVQKDKIIKQLLKETTHGTKLAGRLLPVAGVALTAADAYAGYQRDGVKGALEGGTGVHDAKEIIYSTATGIDEAAHGWSFYQMLKKRNDSVYDALNQ